MNPSRVMLVEDEPSIRRMCQVALERVGKWQVFAVSSGQEALERAPVDRPDVILLDVMMPGMDGLTTLERLRSDDETKHIPVILLTARAQAHEVTEYRKLGADGVIRKPFDPMKLPDEVRRILAELGA